MNRRMILYMPLQILKVAAAVLLLPALVGLIYGETRHALVYLCVGAATFVLSVIGQRVVKPWTKVIYAREGFVIVALTWVLMSLVGALPFVITGDIPNYVNALFETMSGFTTTGASILTDIPAMSHANLFWRSFTHWLGGMGILVFVMAISNMGDRSIHIMRAEIPGPIVGKLVPRARETAKILYLIYMGMTLLEVALLWVGKMPLFDCFIHAFGSAGTGGFSSQAASMGAYDSAYLQWVVTVFMFLFGVNFNIYYLILVKKIGQAVRSTELRTYAAIAVISAAAIAINIRSMYATLGETVRHAAFQVSSILTTTGFSTTDFDRWPHFSRTVLVLLMFVGASAGSTGGGLKVSRVMILFKSMHREIMRLLHPKSVRSLRLEGKKLDETVVHNTLNYFALYMLCFALCFLVVSVDQFNIETSLTATAACFNNIGPGLGAVGPTASYAGMTTLSKLTLTLAMLLGRLEIFPVLLAVAPATWQRK
ncbi:MAG: TrkH family potassium uptake protein [Clostridia bacterium]|nr:TrkH family potassium uptake protein [Clostridia bacterium]